MNLLARLYYFWRRFAKMISIFMVIAGPGIIVMVADNDAGGITTYTVTGALFLFSFIWIEVLLGPVAYICLKTTSTLKDASLLFARYTFRALPILDVEGRIVGVVQYRDVMQLKHIFFE